MGEEPREFITLIGGFNQVGCIDNVLAGSLSACTISTALSHGTSKSARLRFRNFYLFGDDGLDNTFLKVDWIAHGGPRASSTSIHCSHLAHDIVTSAEVERSSAQVIVLENPLCTVTEYGREVLEFTIPILALNVNFLDWGA